jgi:hypothetical protein
MCVCMREGGRGGGGCKGIFIPAGGGGIYIPAQEALGQPSSFAIRSSQQVF